MTSWGFKMTTRSSIMVSGTFIFVLKYEQNQGFERLDTQNGLPELTMAS